MGVVLRLRAGIPGGCLRHEWAAVGGLRDPATLVAPALRAALQGYFLPASLAGLGGYWLAGFWAPAVTNYFLLSLPIVLAAIVLGRQVNQRLKGSRSSSSFISDWSSSESCCWDSRWSAFCKMFSACYGRSSGIAFPARPDSQVELERSIP